MTNSNIVVTPYTNYVYCIVLQIISIHPQRLYKMQNLIALLLLFALQVFLVLNKGQLLGNEPNALILFFSSLAFGGVYLHARKDRHPVPVGTTTVTQPAKIAGALAGILSVMALCFGFMTVFHMYPETGKYSDVIPQLEALYNRFVAGDDPYVPVVFDTYSAYPVYMPMHWLPIGITRWLGMDDRLLGWLLFIPVLAIAGYHLIKSEKRLILQIAGIFIIVSPMWLYLKFASLEMAISFETIIAAYYLLLATGLKTRSFPLITLGLILSLLSRYTLIFWIPLLGYLLLLNQPLKLSIRIWGIVAMSIIILYVLPFIVKNPTALQHGLAYHQEAVVNDWKGYGEPPVSWSMLKGLNFAHFIKRKLTGSMAHRVYIARIIQAIALLITLAIGILYYHLERRRYNYYDYALGFLYLFLMVFFSFSPLTYQYYLLVPLTLAGFMTADVITDHI